ncbi:MAG: Uma2 family endonuclease [Armatimonadetes bacterium]|nr:Uma2 family endonuclease [Armatimonadota bacterium]
MNDTTEHAPTANRVVLTGIRWETYEAILRDHEDRSAPRFTYDTGLLEIMSPLRFHERTNRLAARLVEEVLEAWGRDYDNIGSLTLKMPSMEKGVEPDTCFYIAHVGALNERETADLEQGDPPPDLVIEIDDHSLSVARLPIYAAFGVPEIWRIRRKTIEILLLLNGAYAVAETSANLPPLTPDILSSLLQKSETMTRGDWADAVTDWAKTNVPETETGA